MTTATSGAFRSAGIAALPIVLALGFVGGESARKDLFAIGQGSQTSVQCIEGIAHMVCAEEAPTASGEVPFLGELTVTAPRSEFAASAVGSTSGRSHPARPQAGASPAKYLSVL
jgi:hypothetical protein